VNKTPIFGRIVSLQLVLFAALDPRAAFATMPTPLAAAQATVLSGMPSAVFNQEALVLPLRFTHRVLISTRQLFEKTRLTTSKIQKRRLRFRNPFIFEPVPILQFETGDTGYSAFSKIPKWQSPIFFMEAMDGGSYEKADVTSTSNLNSIPAIEMRGRAHTSFSELEARALTLKRESRRSIPEGFERIRIKAFSGKPLEIIIRSQLLSHLRDLGINPEEFIISCVQDRWNYNMTALAKSLSGKRIFLDWLEKSPTLYGAIVAADYVFLNQTTPNRMLKLAVSHGLIAVSGLIGSDAEEQRKIVAEDRWMLVRNRVDLSEEVDAMTNSTVERSWHLSGLPIVPYPPADHDTYGGLKSGFEPVNGEILKQPILSRPVLLPIRDLDPRSAALRNILYSAGAADVDQVKRVTETALDDSDWRVRARMIDVLSAMGGPVARNELAIALLREDHHIAREKGIEALARRSDPRTVPLLIEMLNQSKVWYEREKIAKAIIEIGGHEAAKFVEQNYNAEDYRLREVIRRADVRSVRSAGLPFIHQYPSHQSDDIQQQLEGHGPLVSIYAVYGAWHDFLRAQREALTSMPIDEYMQRFVDLWNTTELPEGRFLYWDLRSMGDVADARLISMRIQQAQIVQTDAGPIQVVVPESAGDWEHEGSGRVFGWQDWVLLPNRNLVDKEIRDIKPLVDDDSRQFHMTFGNQDQIKTDELGQFQIEGDNHIELSGTYQVMITYLKRFMKGRNDDETAAHILGNLRIAEIERVRRQRMLSVPATQRMRFDDEDFGELMVLRSISRGDVNYGIGDALNKAMLHRFYAWSALGRITGHDAMDTEHILESLQEMVNNPDLIQQLASRAYESAASEWLSSNARKLNPDFRYLLFQKPRSIELGSYGSILFIAMLLAGSVGLWAGALSLTLSFLALKGQDYDLQPTIVRAVRSLALAFRAERSLDLPKQTQIITTAA